MGVLKRLAKLCLLIVIGRQIMGLLHDAKTAAALQVVDSDVEITFMTSGMEGVDQFCKTVKLYRGVAITCYAIPCIEGKRVSIQKYVFAFPNWKTAAQDTEDHLNGDAIGGMI